MRKSSGEKRRRRREGRFLAFCDALSLRATMVAVAATGAFALLQVARVLLKA